jgi:hypothetical protein
LGKIFGNKLNAKLSEVNLENDIDQVQDHWNAFERMLVEIVTELAPLALFFDNSACFSYLSAVTKNKLSVCKCLLHAIV